MTAVSGKTHTEWGGKTRGLAPFLLFEDLALTHRSAERLPLPLQDSELRAVHSVGKRSPIHPCCYSPGQLSWAYVGPPPQEVPADHLSPPTHTSTKQGSFALIN